MDKYGVETPVPEHEKTGAPVDLCRICGEKAVRTGTVLRCPVHGTEPFEGANGSDRK